MATAPRKSGSRKNSGRSGRNSTPQRDSEGRFRSNGSHWGTAAIVGGVAAVGAAATAALFALRGKSWSDFEDLIVDKDDDATGTAHQADGTDSSASFKAKIADEGTVPA